MAMINSILTDIKRSLGFAEENEQFDPDIIMQINAAFATLGEVGLGPTGGFEITDKTATWADILNDKAWLNDVKSYIYLKTKIVVDPPAFSHQLVATKELLAEYIWRIKGKLETPPLASSNVLDGGHP